MLEGVHEQQGLYEEKMIHTINLFDDNYVR